jgi:hypothetical protein
MDEERLEVAAIDRTGNRDVSGGLALRPRRGDCEHLTMVTCVRCGRTYAQRVAEAATPRSLPPEPGGRQ